ncbi:MAG: hypothetical protein NUV45_05895 [Tepidanaerobacteraceae bacterium]|nr:hypothetical protein [Tepidanaerobacteraceae bacterium]
MSMRPVDLQVIVPRTTETTRIQQTLKEGNETQQSALTAQFQEQLRVMKEKVYERARPEEIREEGDKNHRQKDGKAKQNGKKRDNSKKTSHIDVRI